MRQKYLSPAKRIVVKVGTNVLAAPGKPVDDQRVDAISEQIATLMDRGYEVALVSSGAIGSGMAELDFTVRPTTLPELQASASVGQSRLVTRYAQSMHRHGYHAGQILLTRDDFDARDRYLNAKNTIRALFDMECVPIINENDTISTDEIRFGDNDLLAALVTHMIQAEVLVLLTSVPGLCATKPYPSAVCSVFEGPAVDGMQGEDVDILDRVDDEVMDQVHETISPSGTGGMGSKLEAVRIATEAGEAAVMADGRMENVLLRVMEGEDCGTLILPAGEKLRSRKRWIRFTSRPQGAIMVDAGAQRALEERGKSLLPSGIVGVKGQFTAGDVVRIEGPDGTEFARGLSNYDADEVKQIKGLKTHDIEDVLGHKYYDEVVHRDNLALME
ncbi:MAG: glutamate 5-kinase [Planctomycetota bacterium]